MEKKHKKIPQIVRQTITMDTGDMIRIDHKHRIFRFSELEVGDAFINAEPNDNRGGRSSLKIKQSRTTAVYVKPYGISLDEQYPSDMKCLKVKYTIPKIIVEIEDDN